MCLGLTQFNTQRAQAGVELELDRTHRATLRQLAGQRDFQVDTLGVACHHQRSIQQHRRGACVQQRRLQCLQRGGQRPVRGRPAALAGDAAGALLLRAEVSIERANIERCRVVGPGAEFELHAAQRQPAFVPAACQRVAQVDADAGWLVERAARGHCATGQGGSRCGAAEGGYVEFFGLRLQFAQRPR